MNTKTIDENEMMRLLEKAVEDRGADWKYPASTCLYFWEPDLIRENEMHEQDSGVVYFSSDMDPDSFVALQTSLGDEPAPACMVGYALWEIDHGLLYKIMEEMRNYENAESVLRTDLIVHDTRYWFTPAAIEAAYAAQQVQDSGGTWGDALLAAKRALDPDAS